MYANNILWCIYSPSFFLSPLLCWVLALCCSPWIWCYWWSYLQNYSDLFHGTFPPLWHQYPLEPGHLRSLLWCHAACQHGSACGDICKREVYDQQSRPGAHTPGRKTVWQEPPIPVIKKLKTSRPTISDFQ